MGERFLHTEEVVGSIPTSPTILKRFAKRGGHSAEGKRQINETREKADRHSGIRTLSYVSYPPRSALRAQLFALARYCMSKKEKCDQVIAHYSKIIESNPNDYRAYNNRGNAYQQRGDYDLSLSDYDKALELNPSFDLCYINRGNTYHKTGNYERAVSDYDKAILLNPENAMAYNNRGFVFMVMRKYAEAEKDLKKSIELNPNNIYALNSMAEFYSVQNNAAEACKWLAKAIDRGYNNWLYIKSSHTYDNVRTAACFKEIMKMIGHRPQ